VHARQAFTQGVRDLVDIIADAHDDAPAKARRRAALVTFSTMLGAMVLARAVDDAEFADEILAAARHGI
jgi:TetR/AcrR family transcriptional repressor of nem operon